MAIAPLLDRMEGMKFFSTKYKLPIHIAQLILITAAVGLTVPRLFIKTPGPRSRMNTIALSMGAKSFIILAYVLLTDHLARFAKWKSLKAYTILSGLEVVFWGGVAGLMFRQNMQRCVGITCGLSWGVIALAIIINQTEVYTFIVSYLEWRAWKRDRNTKPTPNNRANVETAYEPHRGAAPGNQDLPQYSTRYEMRDTSSYGRTNRYGRYSNGSDGSDVALKTGGPWDQAHIRENMRSPSPVPPRRMV